MGFGLGDITGGLTSFGGATQIPGVQDLGLDILTGGAVSNAKSVDATNQAQIGLANQQMAFQERMSSSAYQRAVDDMRKAGLNPALAYQNGGASTPSGSMAQLTAPRKGDIGAGLFNTAKGVATASADIQQTKSQTDLNNMKGTEAEANAARIGAQQEESQTSSALNRQNLEIARHNTRAAKATADSKEIDAKIKQARKPGDLKVAPYQPYIDIVDDALGAVSTGANVMRRLP